MFVRYLLGSIIIIVVVVDVVVVIVERRCRGEEKLQDSSLHGIVGMGRMQHAQQDGNERLRHTTCGSTTVWFYLVLQQIDASVKLVEGNAGGNLIKQCFEGCWLVSPQYLFWMCHIVILPFLAPILLSFLLSFLRKRVSSVFGWTSGSIRIGGGRKVSGLDGKSIAVSTERARMDWQQARDTRPKESILIAIAGMLLVLVLVLVSSLITITGLREESASRNRRPLLSDDARSRSLGSYSHSACFSQDSVSGPYKTPIHGRIQAQPR
jgi:hypothetical protein